MQQSWEQRARSLRGQVAEQLGGDERLVDAHVALGEVQRGLVDTRQLQAALVPADRLLKQAQAVVAHGRAQLPPPVLATRVRLHAAGGGCGIRGQVAACGGRVRDGAVRRRRRTSAAWHSTDAALSLRSPYMT